MQLERAKSRLKAARRCISCSVEKSSDQFYCYEYKTTQGKQGVRHESRCKECARSRRIKAHHKNRPEELRKMRKRRAENRDAYLANLYAYRAANREKVLRQRVVSQQRREAKKLGKDDNALIERVLEEARFGDKYLDAYTGELIDRPEIDHIVPISRGGAHAYENLCVTSRSNNSSKHARPLLVWLATR